MTIPEFDPATPDPSPAVVRIGDGDAGPVAGALAGLAGDLATTPPELPAPIVAVTPTVVVTDPGTHANRDDIGTRVAAALSAIPEGPVRLRQGDAERFVDLAGPAAADPGGDVAEGTRASRLAHAIRELAGTDPMTPILVQMVPGWRHETRWYPTVGGCLLTENHYPISYMKPEEGIVYAVLGLAGDLTHDRQALRFSPAYPDIMPDFNTPDDILRNSQRRFRALDLERLAGTESLSGPEAIQELDLDVAADDGPLGPVGGVVSLENQTVYPGIHRPGVRVVTMAALRRGHPVPLTKVLSGLVTRLRNRFPGSMRLDFTMDLASRAAGAPGEPDASRLMIGSLTPLPDPIPIVDPAATIHDVDLASDPTLICASGAALGHGDFPGVRDLVYLPPSRFDISRSMDMAREISDLNRVLTESGRPYVLIGSGRWGSTDRALGVPVDWNDISGAIIQVEVALEGFNIESSRGTHFFREMIVNGVGYLHVSLSGEHDAMEWERLDAFPAPSEGTFARHLSFETSLRILVDGRRGQGWIRLPAQAMRIPTEE